MNMHAFRWLLRPDASDSDRHRRPRRRPGRRDGRVSGRVRRAVRELLEDRRLLATIEVTSLADNLDTDGRVTLREAILAAEIDTSVDGSAAGDGADQIVFAPNLPPEPLRLQQAADDTWGLSAFRITTPLAIVANGRMLTRDADAPQFRFFYVDPTGQLELTGLTLARRCARADRQSPDSRDHSGQWRRAGLGTGRCHSQFRSVGAELRPSVAELGCVRRCAGRRIVGRPAAGCVGDDESQYAGR